MSLVVGKSVIVGVFLSTEAVAVGYKKTVLRIAGLGLQLYQKRRYRRCFSDNSLISEFYRQ